MGQRREAREMAVQILYQVELSGAEVGQALELFWHTHARDNFTEDLARGVTEHRQELDRFIEKHSTHWKLSRMPSVDRNILRLAVFELLHQKETPSTVVINEAIEIGKNFGTNESASFINGVLDQIAKEVQKG